VAVLVVLVALVPVATSTFVYAEQNTAPANWTGHDAVAASPSLHNPNFDNGHWYEFHIRYQGAYPTGVWVPAGTDMNDLTQDWRLWFLDGTDIVDCDPDTNYSHSGVESVKMRSFSWSSVNRQVAGLYQVITDIQPCRSYKFQMYGYSRQKESDDWLADFKVGIEPTGWHPDSANDPAVHSWPSTMVWGTSHTEYTSDFGLLEVTAEALDTEIAVFLYADARGGNSHKIHWDTGSFESVASSDNLLDDPDSRVVNESGITSGPTYTAGPEAVTVHWSTSADASNQVYYRRVSGTPSPPIGTLLTHVIYLPLVNRSQGPWLWTDVDDTSGTSHSILIMDLEPGTTYEYFVVSRGYSGGSCVLWVSNVKEFTTTQ
jgi:hypothetical protein